MGELRLVPAAVAVWAAAACAIVFGVRAAVVVVLLCAGIAAVWRAWGQVLMVAGLGAASTIVAWLRLRTAHRWDPAGEIAGTVAGAPKQIASGGYLVRVQVAGVPSPTPVFTDEVPDDVVAGASVVARGAVSESGVAGINPYAINGTVQATGPPEGFARLALHTRETFAAAVERTVGDHAQGLIPGMVLGDTSLQSAGEQQAYVDTGLSHLSAVSGANIAIVTAFAAVLAAAVGLGLRGRVVASASALLLYAALVGPDPSVLRASVTGLVGLTAVLASRQSEPVHALCLAVIALVLVDSNLAVHYGFALSVGATVGIVALFPMLYRALAKTGWPDILVRALAVAVAADVATMPIIALMAGRVSLVSVVANVLVAPVTGPVTVLGLAAAVCSLAPGGMEAVLLFIVEPLARWVRLVADVGAGLPVATINAAPLYVLVIYGWFLAGVLCGRPRMTLVVAVVCGVVVVKQPPAVELDHLRAHVVATKEDVEPVPPGTQLVVVLEHGRPHTRPVVTDQGIPVIFPNRDGVATIYPDGTQVLPRRAF